MPLVPYIAASFFIVGAVVGYCIGKGDREHTQRHSELIDWRARARKRLAEMN